jgi:hypothetical protein
MLNALTKRFGEGRTALILPLAGYVVLWLCVVGGAFATLYEPQTTYSPNGVSHNPQIVHAAIYLFIAGLGALGWASVQARSLAINGEKSRLLKVAGGFALVSVIVTLIAGAIFGIASLMSSLAPQWGVEKPNELIRILNVYVPILLTAGLLLFVIIKAFVGVHKDGDDE